MAIGDEVDYVPPNGQLIPLTPEDNLVAGWLREANNECLQETSSPYVQGNSDIAEIGVSLFSKFQSLCHFLLEN